MSRIGAAGNTFAGEEEERGNEPVPAEGCKEVRMGGVHLVVVGVHLVTYL